MRLSVLALLVMAPLVICAGLILWPDLAPKTGWCVIALAVLAGGYWDHELLIAEAGLPLRASESLITTPAPEK